MRTHFALGMFLAATTLAAPLIAQGPGGPGGGPPTGPLTPHQITPTAYWVEGGVGNTGFLVGDKGVVVVDATISEASAKLLLAEIAKVTPKPVTTVLLTHGDGDHVNGLGAFPAGATIIAQENDTKRLKAGVEAGKVHIPADHLPNKSIVSKETITADGIKLELYHWAPAHTDGDLIIFVPAEKIVFTGDIFAMNQYRALIHLESGGTSEGWITTAKGILALDATKFVVGHGDLQTKATLQERLNLVVAERDQIKKLVAEGKSLQEVETAVGDPPPAPAGGPAPRFMPFAEVVYKELTAK